MTDTNRTRASPHLHIQTPHPVHTTHTQHTHTQTHTHTQYFKQRVVSLSFPLIILSFPPLFSVIGHFAYSLYFPLSSCCRRPDKSVNCIGIRRWRVRCAEELNALPLIFPPLCPPPNTLTLGRTAPNNIYKIVRVRLYDIVDRPMLK
jgi:hypothetical protein